uniref:Uncharacterized protein n=1 Tax=Arundo donax TaxID=35708 RepID=A0A0A8ZF29_ARUDO
MQPSRGLSSNSSLFLGKVLTMVPLDCVVQNVPHF